MHFALNAYLSRCVASQIKLDACAVHKIIIGLNLINPCLVVNFVTTVSPLQQPNSMRIYTK